MLREALEYVFGQAKERAFVASAKLVSLPSDGRTVTLEHNGVLIDRVVPPALRSHSVDSVADLIEAAKRWKDDPVIWINEHGVVLVTDDKDRRESVTLPLVHSAIYNVVAKLATNGAIEQSVLVRYLRREFRKSPDAATLLAAVRKIKFKNYSDGFSTVEHGNESLGRTIENEVTGAADIPEMMTVPCAVFSNPGESAIEFTIGMDLEIDAKNQKFVLKPMPDELEVAVASALSGIQSRIRGALDSKVPVFFGRP